MLWTGFAITEEKAAMTADKHKERGLKCEVCHKEAQPKAAAPAEACLACHQSLENVAKKTENYTVNPHDNHITKSSEVECTMCHQGHKEDILLCHNCHQGLHIDKVEQEKK